MNGIGKQRSGAPTVHHKRQYSDHLLDALSNGRWLQSAGLQHLQSSNANNNLPPLQVLIYYLIITCKLHCCFWFFVYGSDMLGFYYGG